MNNIVLLIMFKSLINFFFFIKFHHSVKNLLILLPLFAAHNFKIIFNFDWILHFFYWSIFSHFAYYVNNLYDYNSDAKNILKNIKYYKPNKKIIIFWSIFILTILLLEFNYLLKNILILYLLLNIFYTFFFKKIKFFDIFILSIFFILRILYGAIYFDISLSVYFIFFIFFILFCLSMNKRIVELIYNPNSLRPYYSSDIKIMNYIYYLSFTFSLLIFLFYIFTNQAKNLYINNYFLLINLFIYIGIFKNFTFQTRNHPYIDIIIFIYKDKINFILLILFIFIFFINVKSF